MIQNPPKAARSPARRSSPRSTRSDASRTSSPVMPPARRTSSRATPSAVSRASSPDTFPPVRRTSSRATPSDAPRMSSLDVSRPARRTTARAAASSPSSSYCVRVPPATPPSILAMLLARRSAAYWTVSRPVTRSTMRNASAASFLTSSWIRSRRIALLSLLTRFSTIFLMWSSSGGWLNPSRSTGSIMHATLMLGFLSRLIPACILSDNGFPAYSSSSLSRTVIAVRPPCLYGGPPCGTAPPNARRGRMPACVPHMHMMLAEPPCGAALVQRLPPPSRNAAQALRAPPDARNAVSASPQIVRACVALGLPGMYRV